MHNCTTVLIIYLGSGPPEDILSWSLCYVKTMQSELKMTVTLWPPQAPMYKLQIINIYYKNITSGMGKKKKK